MKKQRGFTLIELLAAGWGLVCIAGIIVIAIIAVHFVSKFW